MLPGSVITSGLPIIPFFTILRTLFLLKKFVFIVTLTGLWHRLSNNLILAFACPSLQHLWGGWTRLKAGYQFNVQKCPVAESSGGSEAKKPCSDPRIESHLSEGKSYNSSASASVADSRMKGIHEGWCSHFWSLQLHQHLYFLCRLIHFPNF